MVNMMILCIVNIILTCSHSQAIRDLADSLQIVGL